MPTFLVSAPGGEVFTVNAPEGATESDAIRYVKSQYGGARTGVPQIDESQFDTGVSSEDMLQSLIAETPKDTSLSTLASNAWERGKGELGVSLGPKLKGFLGSIVGADEYAKQKLEQAAQESAQLEKEHPTQLGSYEDVKSIPEAGRFLLEQGVQQLPNFAPSLGMGLAGAAVAGPPGAIIGAVLGSFAMEAPDTLENLYQETGDLHVPTAVVAGGMKAALDAVLGARLAKPIRAAVGTKLLERSGMEPNLVKTAAKELFKDTGIEGVTEGAQQAIDVEAEKIVSEDLDVWTSDDFKSVLNASIIGAASAVGPGAFSGAKSVLAEKRATQELETAAREKEAAEAPVTPPVDEAAVRAEQIDALNTQIADLQTQFQAAQDALNTNPKDKRTQYAASQIDAQIKDLLKQQEELSLTPEELAVKRQREEAMGEMKLPEAPEEYTGEHMLKLLGMSYKEARKVLDANNIELNLKRPIKGAEAESFSKFLDLVQPDDVRDIARVKDEARRAPAVEDFISRVEQIRDQHPNLQPEAIKRDKVLGVRSNKFGATFNEILAGRPLNLEKPEVLDEVYKDIVARRDEALNYGNTEFASYLDRKISKSPALREAALKAQEGPVQEEAPTLTVQEGTPTDEVPEAPVEAPVEAPTPPPVEIQEAKNYLASIDQGGVPFAPFRLNRLLNNLGLETVRTETPQQKIQRVRDAVARYDESVAPQAAPTPTDAPTPTAAPTPSPQRTIIEQPTPRVRLQEEKPQAQREFAQTVRQYAITPDQPTAKRAYEGAINMLNGTIRNTLEWKSTPEAVKNVIGAMSNLPGATKRFLYSSATLGKLADIVETYNKPAADDIRALDRILSERHTEAVSRVQGISKILLDNTEKMKKFSREQIEKFETVAHELSRLEIDPYNNANKNHPLYKQFHALDKDLRDVFDAVVKKYEADADELLDNFEKLTDGAFTPVMKAKYKLMRKRIKPFLPLYREGDYWMGYTDATGESVVQSFQSEIERKLAKEDAVRDGIPADSISLFKQVSEITPERMRPTREMASLLKVMEEKNVDKEVRDKAYQMFLQMFPAQSVMQQFRKRQGRKGYRAQVLQNFSVVGSRMADAVNKFKYARSINDTYARIKEALIGEHQSGQDTAIDIYNELLQREAYLRNPSNNYIANFASAASYNQYLLGNVSSAMANNMSLVMSTLPVLGGRYGYPQTMAAMSKALGMYWNGGRDDNTTMRSKFTGRKLSDKTFMGDAIRAKAEKAPTGSYLYNLKRLYDAAIGSQAVHQSVSIDTSGFKNVPATEYTGTWANIKASLGWLFQNSERMNREITLLSTFELEMQRLRKEGVVGENAVDEAIETAIQTVKKTQGEAIPETGARIFQNNIGKVIGTFKKYPLTQLYLMHELFRDAFKGADSKTRMIAAKQLLGIYGIGFAFTGIKGLPLVGAFSFLASLLLGDEDEPFNPDQRATEIFGQMGWNGLMNSFTGVRMSDRLQIGSFFREDPKRLAELGPVWYAAEQLVGPTASMVKNYQEAYKSLNDGDWVRALERALPLGAANVIKAVDHGINGVRTKDGAKIVDDLNTWNLITQAVGWQPEVKARAYDINNVENQITTAVNTRKTKLLRDLWRNRNDPEKLAEAKAAINHYNNSKYGRRNPIDSESIMKSTKQYISKTRKAEQHGGMSPDERLAPEFRAYEEAAGGF